MKNYPTTCKFCGCGLVLKIDDSYDEIGDPFKLLKLAACNNCADVRVWRRKVEARIDFTVSFVKKAKADKDSLKLDALKRKLDDLCREYLRMVAQWMGQSEVGWDPQISESIIDNPELWNKVLAQCWKLFGQPDLPLE